MIVLLPATFHARDGLDPGPRVRPPQSRWTLPEAAVRAARDAGGVPVGVVPGAPDGPVVLVTLDRGPGEHGPEARISEDYVQAVLGAGGQPWLLPPGEPQVEALLARADAIVLTGGAFDIHPHHYGEDVLGRLDRVEEDRTVLELALARAALATGKPVLGVCGGMQVMAVADGGALVQDLPAEPAHEQPSDPAAPWHPVRLTGRLAGLLGAAPAVNSTHHQAVRRTGSRFVATGWSPDGVIEAMEAPDHPFALGVQWHPERLGDLRLYRALVEAACATR